MRTLIFLLICSLPLKHANADQQVRRPESSPSPFGTYLTADDQQQTGRVMYLLAQVQTPLAQGAQDVPTTSPAVTFEVEAEETGGGAVPADWFREQPFSEFGGPRQGYEAMEYVRVAADARMQNDMGADAQQRKKLKEIYQTAVEDEAELFAPLRGEFKHPLPAKVRRRAEEPGVRRKIWEAAKLRVDAILTGQQSHRIEQIMIQRLSHRILLDENHADHFKFSDQQKEDLHQQWLQHIERVRTKVMKGQESYRHFWTEAYQILSQQQRSKFDKLRGPVLREHAEEVAQSARPAARDIIGMRDRVRREEREAGAKLEATATLRGAPDLTGHWLMTLPAGFVYQVVIEPTPGNRYRLDIQDRAVVLEGIYRWHDGQLRVVTPDDKRMEKLAWKRLNPNVLVLVSQLLPSPNGQNYIDATLTRVPPKARK